jgi:hypothetical protein
MDPLDELRQAAVASEDAMSEFADCFVTQEETKRRLEAIERKLGKQLGLGIDTNVRRELIARDLRGELPWSADVGDWQQTYASYIDWIDAEAV